MESPVTLSCATCTKVFEKSAKEYRRQLKTGRSYFYCGLPCQTKARNKLAWKRSDRIKELADNRRDGLTHFRWFTRNALKRPKKGVTDLTPEFLKGLWEIQRGVCPLTGWRLRLPPTGEGWTRSSPISIDSASLDRIDNTKGYLQGNVRFVAVIANYARNVFTDADVVKFASAVVQRQTLAG